MAPPLTLADCARVYRPTSIDRSNSRLCPRLLGPPLAALLGALSSHLDRRRTTQRCMSKGSDKPAALSLSNLHNRSTFDRIGFERRPRLQKKGLCLPPLQAHTSVLPMPRPCCREAAAGFLGPPPPAPSKPDQSLLPLAPQMEPRCGMDEHPKQVESSRPRPGDRGVRPCPNACVDVAGSYSPLRRVRHQQRRPQASSHGEGV